MALTHFSGPIVSTNGFSTGSGSTEVITAAETLTFDADNGKTHFLDAAAGATVTLPALTAGGHHKFIVTSAFATTNWIVASAEGDNISGNLLVAGAHVPAAAEDQINFVATAEGVGDWIELWADTTNSQWIVTGVGALTGGITATDPA